MIVIALTLVQNRSPRLSKQLTRPLHCFRVRRALTSSREKTNLTS